MEQRTNEWLLARFGKFTGSEVGALMVKGRGADFGAGALTYIDKVAAARCLRPHMTPEVMGEYNYYCGVRVTAAMQRGADSEPESRQRYAFMRGVEVKETGSVDHPTVPWFAASPDGLVGDDGAIEIKDMGADNYFACRFHVKDAAGLHDFSKTYYWQVQSVLACTGRKWCDFVVRCSVVEDVVGTMLPLHIVRIERDEEAIAQLCDRVVKANGIVESLMAEAHGGNKQ